MVTMTQDTTRDELIAASIRERRQAMQQTATMIDGVLRIPRTVSEIKAKLEECNDRIEEERRELWAYLAEDHTREERRDMIKGIDNVIASYHMIRMALEWVLGIEPGMRL